MFPSPPLGEFAGINIAKPELILPAYLLVFFCVQQGQVSLNKNGFDDLASP